MKPAFTLEDLSIVVLYTKGDSFIDPNLSRKLPLYSEGIIHCSTLNITHYIFHTKYTRKITRHSTRVTCCSRISTDGKSISPDTKYTRDITCDCIFVPHNISSNRNQTVLPAVPEYLWTLTIQGDITHHSTYVTCCSRIVYIF